MKSPLLFLLLSALVTAPAVVSARDVHVLIGGLGGEAEYAERFEQALSLLQKALDKPQTAAESGDSEANAALVDQVILLPPAATSRTRIIEVLAEVAEQTTPEDFVSVTLVGHGTYDGEHYKFNIAGVDLTDADFKTALQAIPTQRQLVVVSTSASGVLLKTLEQAGRVVVTATKSGGEANVVVFPTHWADALSTAAADSDRNEIVTVGEAFDYAQRSVDTYYTEQGLLASEHARLVGDGEMRMSLVRIGALRNAIANPIVDQLLNERHTLEVEFNELRARKSLLGRDEYYAELEQLMLRMAQIQSSIDRETGWDQRDAADQGS